MRIDIWINDNSRLNKSILRMNKGKREDDDIISC